jgi:hypothetical protein
VREASDFSVLLPPAPALLGKYELFSYNNNKNSILLDINICHYKDAPSDDLCARRLRWRCKAPGRSRYEVRYCTQHKWSRVPKRESEIIHVYIDTSHTVHTYKKQNPAQSTYSMSTFLTSTNPSSSFGTSTLSTPSSSFAVIPSAST